MKLSRWAGLLAGVTLLSALGGIAASAGEAALGRCGGLTTADAAAILHIAQTQVQGPRIAKDVGLDEAYNCRYRDSKNIFKSVNFDLTIESVAAAKHNMNEERQNFGGVASFVQVKNLGDEAWRYSWRGFGPPPRLLVRKGNVWLDVHEPEDEPSQIKIAQIVLQHIR